MKRPGWTRVATVLDTISAEVIRRRLTAEGVAVEIVSDSSLLGEARRCEIYVPSGAAPRARFLLEEDLASPAELERLASLSDGSDPADDGHKA